MAIGFKNGFALVRQAATDAGIIQGDEGDDQAARLIAEAIGGSGGAAEDVSGSEPDAGGSELTE